MPSNLITDVDGLRVGHADDQTLASGVTAIVFDAPAVAAIDKRGGGRGTRETDLSDPGMTVDHIDALVLSGGGSALGLEAAAGVQAWLREQGRGFAVRSARVPIVPGAILFDLLNGGDKDWGRFPPYRDLGYRAAVAAAALSSVAGHGSGLHRSNAVGSMGGAGFLRPCRRARLGRAPRAASRKAPPLPWSRPTPRSPRRSSTASP